jgi:hypothetical protein
MSNVTVQLTRKSIKAQRPFALVTLVLGVALCVIGANSMESSSKSWTIGNGVLTTFGGVVWLSGLRLAKWWHHD